MRDPCFKRRSTITEWSGVVTALVRGCYPPVANRRNCRLAPWILLENCCGWAHAHCLDEENADRWESLGVRLHPLTEATGVLSRADGGEGLAWIAHHLPQMLQPFAKPIDSGQIHQAQKITLVWPVQDMEGVGNVGQQPAVLALRSPCVWCTMYGPRCGNRIKLSPPSQ